MCVLMLLCFCIMFSFATYVCIVPLYLYFPLRSEMGNLKGLTANKTLISTADKTIISTANKIIISNSKCIWEVGVLMQHFCSA